MRIEYAIVDSPLGRLLVAATDRGVCAVYMASADDALVQALKEEYPAAAAMRRSSRALMAIPYGETRTYKEVAASIGNPSAVRAVAHACATNPVSLVIPCHRVVRTTGNLAGYRWGVGRKQALLAAEHRMKDR
jgi:AraC family transcriptional regulator of adaptative response/methylated-DNA-[protein]-cysteine methyltransferase